MLSKSHVSLKRKANIGGNECQKSFRDITSYFRSLKMGDIKKILGRKDEGLFLGRYVISLLVKD